VKHRGAGSSRRPAAAAARASGQAAAAVGRRPASSPSPLGHQVPTVAAAPTVQVGNWQLVQGDAGDLLAVWLPTGETRTIALPPQN
jgi:hypothetical protein